MAKKPALDFDSVRDLRRRGFLLQDLLGVMQGLRPMCHSGAIPGGPETWEAFRSFLKATGLRALRHEAPGAAPLLTVGRDPAALKEFETLSLRKAAARATGPTIATTSRMGELLGYPACCTSAFVETESRASSRTASPPVSFPALALARSGPGPFHFSMNFLYNFHSRSSGPKGELGLLLRGGYAAMDRHLLPWIPCSFRCQPSLRYAAKLYAALLACEPAFAEETKRHLAATVVVQDDWAFVPLLGVSRKTREWYYGSTLPVKTLAAAATVELLAAGDRLRRKGARLEVLNGERSLDSLTKGHAVYDFADEP